MYLVLLLICIGLAWFDSQTKRIPNRVTAALLAAGLWLHFPGTPYQWFGCLFLIAGWRMRKIGGGDAKLWMALLWLAPPALSLWPVIAMGIVLIASALIQIVWRWGKSGPVAGVRSPAAWRAIPYALWLFLVVK